MSNIKFFGNAKIQGKTFFQLLGSSPTYAIGKSLSAVNEGSSVTFTLSTTNVVNGTIIPYVITGVSLADLASGALTGNFTLSGNRAIATITLAADALTEGSETMTVSLSSGVASASVVVNDTSRTPHYTLTSSTALVNEGSSVTFTLSTANVANGTVLPYVISGISSGDLSSGSLTGSFTVFNDSASTSITLANDVLTEGTETATLSTAVGSVTVTVNDTSRAPTYSIGRSMSAVNEGSSVTFTLSTQNVPNGTEVPYTISGISLADITSGSLTGSFTVNNNLATASFILAADALTEGTETLTLSTSVGSVAVDVNDTSKNPTYAISRSIYNVNEGSSVTFTLSTTDVSNGTTIPYTISGISLSDLSSGSLSGNFTVSNNLATANVSLTADNLTEGTEQITIALNNAQASSFALAIDTSLSLPMTLSGTNLVGWYDYTYGAYNTVGNFVDDENASTWTISMVPGPLYNFQRSKSTVNDRTSYNHPANIYSVSNSSIFYSYSINAYDLADISMYWTGTNWRVEVTDIYRDDGEGGKNLSPNYTPRSMYWDATGDTRYPWEANWGTGNSVTRQATVSSTPATEGQTVTHWQNKVNRNNNFAQSTLASQPILSAGSIQLNTKWMSTNFNQFATRTYYFVGNARNTQATSTRSILNFAGTTSTTSTMRHALITRNTSNVQRYGLSQGTTTAASIQSTYAPLSSWTGKPQIVCASFSSANNGKISLNNSSESSLTAIGNNFPSSDVNGNNPLYLGSSEANSFINVKEILVFDSVHTTEQKTQVINYLNAKYNAF